jgi:hypothetical protein
MEKLKKIDWLKVILVTFTGAFLLNGIINAVQNLF